MHPRINQARLERMSERHSSQDVLTEPWPGAGLGTRLEFPDTVVHEMVDHWADTTPDAVALGGPGGEMTYQHLVHRANQLGNYLVAAEAGENARIGVCLPRGTDAVTALLAVLKAGCTYVPLDPALPQDRLDYMTEDAELATVLTAE
jgi:non-ribosomal peptide synthetase component F